MRVYRTAGRRHRGVWAVSLDCRVRLSLTDAQLLERFVSRRDEPAFAALMVRHGPMVLSLCRQMLRDKQEAEDAFQASFLVLARNAASIQKRPSLSSGSTESPTVWRRVFAEWLRDDAREAAGVDLPSCRQ